MGLLRKYLALLLCFLLVWSAGYVQAEQLTEVSEAELAQIAPVSAAQTARIDALPTYDAADTWAVYVYMSGSDLESGGMDGLAELTRMITRAERDAYVSSKYAVFEERVLAFVKASEEAGIKLPSALYRPQAVEEASEQPADAAQEGEVLPEEEQAAPRLPASASLDLQELFQAALPKNIRFVIQTGGALAWENENIDSNRSQRFVYDSEGFHEVSDRNVENMGNPNTLEGFLRFCEANYQADHKLLLFWNHGAGSFGFGTDEIFQHDTLTLTEMKSALQAVYGTSASQKPFELIGFDACLMASLEVANALADFGNYLLASEELEPGFGWDYSGWVADFASNTATNGARIGRSIADSFVKTSVREAKDTGYDYDVTLSLTDLGQVRQLYAAYEAFAAEALKKSIENPHYLALLGQKANRSIRYAQEMYRIYNTIDLGNFMDGVMEYFPDTARAVKEALEKASLYQRNSTYVQGSQGLSVYFPIYMDEMNGFENFLSYIHEISLSDAINSLYFYKIGAFLDQKHQSYASKQGYGTALVIDTSVLKRIGDTPIDVQGNVAQLPLAPEQAALIQDTRMALTSFDEKNQEFIYYGYDYLNDIDKQSAVCSRLSGKWFGFDKEPIMVEIIEADERYVKYSSPVMYQKERCNLIFIHDSQSGTSSVLGLRRQSQSNGVIDRNLIALKNGDRITPLYKVESDAGSSFKEGKVLRYKEGALGEINLKRGEYMANFELTDLRGDIWYSNWVQFRAEGGSIRDMFAMTETAEQK